MSTLRIVTLADAYDALDRAGCKPKWSENKSHVRAKCPAHEDSSPSLNVSTRDDGMGVVLHCFAGCAHDTIRRALGLDQATSTPAPSRLNLHNLPRASTAMPPPNEPPAELDEHLTAYLRACADRLATTDNPALAVLEERHGIPLDLAKRLRLGYDPGGTCDHPNLSTAFAKPRITIPFLNEHKRPISFQARAIDNTTKPKWANPNGSSSPVGFYLHPDDDPERPILITEGSSDGLTAIGAGYSVLIVRGAALTKNATTKHLLRTLAGTRRIVACGDNDQAGRDFNNDLIEIGAHPLTVPTDHNDLTAWREANPDDFAVALAAAATPPDAPPLADFIERLDLAYLADNPPPPIRWALPNYLAIGTLNLLHGEGGVGKSYLSFGLARAIARGGLIFGTYAEQMPVAIVDAEQSLDEIHRRINTAKIVPDDGIDYYRCHGAILGHGDETLNLIEHIASATSAKVVILDSQRALYGGDEKEQGEVGRMLRELARIAEQLDVCILVIHHDNKEGRYSGSTDINAALSGSRIHLERAYPPSEEDEAKRALRRLSHMKCRVGPEQPPRRFTINVGEDGIEFDSANPLDDLAAHVRERAEAAISVIRDHGNRARIKDICDEVGARLNRKPLSKDEWATVHKALKKLGCSGGRDGNDHYVYGPVA